MSIAKKSAQAQRSSNIFGAPDDKEEVAASQRRENYRMELEQQMTDNARCRMEQSYSKNEHPLESRVERYAVSMKKNVEHEPEPDGEFFIGGEDISRSQLKEQKKMYQSQLREDAAQKKDVLDHKDEDDARARKPFVRSFSPAPDTEFQIGSQEHQRPQRGKSSPGKGGSSFSKKERERQRYKQELDNQIDMRKQRQLEERNKVREEDKKIAESYNQFGNNSEVDNRRKERIAARQDFLDHAARNFPQQTERRGSLGGGSRATFNIGEENRSRNNHLERREDYRNALNEQMEMDAVRKQEARQKSVLEDQKYAHQHVPYMERNGDDEEE